VAFYRDAVREFGDPVLELGCGTGRIMMALADAGKRITGLDLSERMLERAVKKRAALNKEARERVHLVQGDMTQFDLGETFGWSSFPSGHFSTCWKCGSKWIVWTVRASNLSPGGRLILDVFQTDASECTIPCTCRNAGERV